MAIVDKDSRGEGRHRDSWEVGLELSPPKFLSSESVFSRVSPYSSGFPKRTSKPKRSISGST